MYHQEYHEYEGGLLLVPIIPNHAEYYRERNRMVKQAEESATQMAVVCSKVKWPKKQKETWSNHINNVRFSSEISSSHGKQTKPDFSSPSSVQEEE